MIAKFGRKGTFKKDNYPLRGKYSERRKRKFRGKIILFLRILQLKILLIAHIVLQIMIFGYDHMKRAPKNHYPPASEASREVENF